MKPDDVVGGFDEIVPPNETEYKWYQKIHFANLSPEIQLKLTKAEETEANLTEADGIIADLLGQIGPGPDDPEGMEEVRERAWEFRYKIQDIVEKKAGGA